MIHLEIRTLNSPNSRPVTVPKETTVSALKALLNAEGVVDVSPGRLKLIHEGRALNGIGTRLEDAGVQDGEYILALVSRVRPPPDPARTSRNVLASPTQEEIESATLRMGHKPPSRPMAGASYSGRMHRVDISIDDVSLQLQNIMAVLGMNLSDLTLAQDRAGGPMHLRLAGALEEPAAAAAAMLMGHALPGRERPGQAQGAQPDASTRARGTEEAEADVDAGRGHHQQPAQDQEGPPPQRAVAVEEEAGTGLGAGAGAEARSSASQAATAAPAQEPALEEPPASVLQQLVEMGFPEARARKALILHRNNLSLAMEWMLDHEGDPEVDAPPTPRGVRAHQQRLRARGLLPPLRHAPVAAPTQAMEASLLRETLSVLARMGFSGEEAEAAARLCGNNPALACTILLEDRGRRAGGAHGGGASSTLGTSSSQAGSSQGEAMRAAGVLNPFSSDYLNSGTDDGEDDEDYVDEEDEDENEEDEEEEEEENEEEDDNEDEEEDSEEEGDEGSGEGRGGEHGSPGGLVDANTSDRHPVEALSPGNNDLGDEGSAIKDAGSSRVSAEHGELEDST